MRDKRTFLHGLLFSIAVGFFLFAIGSRDLSAIDRERNRDSVLNSAYQQGERNGYEHGFTHGGADRNEGKNLNFRHSQEYRKGDIGWDRSLGQRKDYINRFRAGYEAGYNDGFHGRSSRLAGEHHGHADGHGRAPAYQQGESNGRPNGFHHGEEDKRAGREFNFQHGSVYQSGDLGWDRSMGRREDYINGFRVAYEAGYHEAYYSRGSRSGGRGQGRGFAEQRIVWSGYVDGKDYIKISGDRLWIEHLQHKPITGDSVDIRSPLPRREVDVLLKKIQGRDRVEIVDRPSARNGYTITVLIDDRQKSGDHYAFELSW